MAQKKATTSEWEGTTGLVGTLAVQLVDVNNAAIIARTTAGVVEYPAGSGLYEYPYTEPNVGYQWIFDDGVDYDPGPWITPTIVTAPGTTTAAQPTQTTIRQRFSIGTPAVLTDMQSVTFGDSSGTLGVVRTDTNANVVAPGVALIHESTGVYSFTFADPAFGLTYQYNITFVTPGGVTDYITGTIAGGSGAAVGYYTTQALIEQRAGSYNADLWSNRGDGSTSSADPVGFADAMRSTDSLINRLARVNGYVSPIPTTSADWDYLQDLATDYATAILYTKSRGVHDEDPVSKAMEKLADDSEAALGEMFEEGIDATRQSTTNDLSFATISPGPACGVGLVYPASRTFPWP